MRSGCWTCRLRRKKCDGAHPVCTNCSSLRITCESGDERPPWLDGGDLQKEKAEEVKRKVKSTASRQSALLGATRSNDGCWTCRLRRKRCDETRPVCDNCSSLHISCEFGDERPPWLDGGELQKEKAEEVKRQVKSAGPRRRGAQSTTVSMGAVAAQRGDADDTLGRLGSQLRLPDMLPYQSMPASNSATAPSNHNLQRPSSSSSTSPSLSLITPGSTLTRYSNGTTTTEAELDRLSMMFYFDNFFPFLFPFYAPSLLEGGRSWIIEPVVSNPAMWRTTLCISAVFVSFALDGATPGFDASKVLAWDKLTKQMTETYSMLQVSLQDTSSNSISDAIVKASRLMGSIILLQRFEILIGNFEHCHVHINASIALFKRVFQYAAESTTGRLESITLDNVLGHMGSPLWPLKSQQRRAWSSDQAAFRFYTALLLVDDIIFGASTGQPPQLREFHARLLVDDRNAGDTARLDLADFTACQNWAMLQISEIAVLDAWKKSMKKAGQLDAMELVTRASLIKQTLLDKLQSLDASSSPQRHKGLACFDMYKAQSLHNDSRTFVTRIWAHAALLYLSLVVSGWQPSISANRLGVTQILTLLEQMPARDLLRTMVWPFCIAGCLAQQDEEARFRALADALVPRQLFGGPRKAFEIMENAWKCRHELNADTDLASCISRPRVHALGQMRLGYIPLLI